MLFSHTVFQGRWT